jgi:hypothetical protein
MLAWHPAPAQERDEVLAELTAAPVEMRLVGDANPAEFHGAIGLEPSQPRLDVAVL